MDGRFVVLWEFSIFFTARPAQLPHRAYAGCSDTPHGTDRYPTSSESDENNSEIRNSKSQEKRCTVRYDSHVGYKNSK